MKKLLLLSLCFLMLFLTQVHAQSRTVTGTVTGKDDGLSIPGASVKIKGSKTGVATGADGHYSLSNVPDNAVLIFFFIGYSPVEIPVNGASKVDAVLSTNSKQLSEIVVTALGFRADRDRLATSASTVKGSEISSSGETSALQGLSSKASGVQVVSSGGDPGSSAYIQIRGQSTITNSIQPLFIVDGIPVSNSTDGAGNLGGTSEQSRMSDLNPQDIESTTVLKGAAAAALYGSQAANGVIVITTKRGKNSGGKLNVTLSSTYSLDALNRTVPLQDTYGQGTNGLFSYGNRLSWGDLISGRKGGPDALPANTTNAPYLLLPDGTKRYTIAAGTAANPHGGKNSTEVFDHGTDIFHNGHYWDNNVILSGGDDKTTFYTSVEKLDQQGILLAGSDYHRKAFKANVDRKFGDIFKIATSVNYTNSFSNRAQQGSNVSGIFLGGLRTPADFNTSVYSGTYVDAAGALHPDRQVAYRNPLGANVNSIYDNPLWELHNITSTTKVNRFFGNFEATLNVTKWLSFVERAGVDYYSDDRIDNYPVLSSAFQGGSLTIQELSNNVFNNDFIGRVNTDISKNFTFSGIVGLNYENNASENVGANVKNFTLPDAPFNLGNSAGDARTPFNSRYLARTSALYAQASFAAYDQLFLELTDRYEQSSTYVNRFNFPSASLGWQFTKLLGIGNESKGLSFGKLRLTYGEVGVQPPAYLTNTYYGPDTFSESYGSALDASSAVYGGGYSRSGQQGNANIKPEIKKEEEIGLDLRFLNDRLSLSGTYYTNKTDGAILPVAVPASTGFVNEYANAANIKNKGIELDLGATWIKTKDFSWSTDANFAHNKNLVVSLNGTKQIGLSGFTSVVSSAVPGYPLGVFWGPGFAKSGNKFVLDGNGFPTAASESSVLGDPNPNWTGAITNSFRYKAFKLSFLIDHVQGGQVWNGTKAALATIGTAKFTGTTVTTPTAIKDYNGTVIPAGTTFRGSIEDFGAGSVALTQPWYSGLGGGFGTATGPDYFESGTRTRLRDVSVGYVITGDAFKQKTKLQSIEITASGRNLVLITKYSGIDPETNLGGPVNGRGIDYFNNPSTRSYFFTVKINY